jgi:restriction endonuclease S subunit
MANKEVMQKTEKAYLTLSTFSSLETWSVQALLENKVSYNKKFPLAKIGDFLTKSRETISVEDDVIYKRVTVKINNGGVKQRDTELGKNIGTKNQFIVHAGQFIVSRIDARNGAFGIIPEELEGAIVTNDFPLFNVNTTKILSEFLLHITTTKEFINFAQSCSSGTTNRQRMDIDLFLSQKIALPSISQQKNIINAYNNKIKYAKVLEKQVTETISDIDQYLVEKLGIKKTEVKENTKGLQLFRFNQFDRWDIWVNKTDSITKKYPSYKFGDIIRGKPMYGANVKGVKMFSDTRYIRITDINENGTLDNEFVSPETVEEKYLLKENDFLIARSGNTVGKTFLYKEKYGRAIYAGYLVKYDLDINMVLPEYILEYTKSYPFKQWILSNQRIAGQPNINGQEYLQAPIIVPPFEIQKEIATYLFLKRELVSNQKLSAEKSRLNAQKEFENEIFGK